MENDNYNQSKVETYLKDYIKYWPKLSYTGESSV